MKQNNPDSAKLRNQSTYQVPSRDNGYYLSAMPRHPYIDHSAYAAHSETVNHLFALSCYKRLLNNHGIHQRTLNPFMLPMGNTTPGLQVGPYGNRAPPPPFSNSHFVDKRVKRKYQGSSAGADALHLHSALDNNQANNKGAPSLHSLEDSSKNREDRQKRTIDWEDRLQTLADFKKGHGHCMVPQSHPRLGAWVKWQREKYALYEAGKTSYFTREKIERLNKLGFVWRVRRKRKKSECRNESERQTKTDSDDPNSPKKGKRKQEPSV